jgi:membrane protein implicated in regulation of membrane protease activity
MADDTTAGGTSAGPAPASAPRIAPWLALYTLGRLGIAVALIALIWVVGLGGFPALLFGLLLSMPVAYVLLRPVRDRLTAGLAARSESRQAQKAQLRARLAGEGTEG